MECPDSRLRTPDSISFGCIKNISIFVNIYNQNISLTAKILKRGVRE